MASQQDTVMSNTAIQRQDSDEHPASRQQDLFQETAGKINHLTRGETGIHLVQFIKLSLEVWL